MCNSQSFKAFVKSRESAEIALQNGLFAVHFAGCPGHGFVKLELLKEFQTDYDRLTRPKVNDEERNQTIFLLQQQLEDMRQKTAKLESLLLEQLQ